MKKRALTFILTSVLAIGYCAVIGGFITQGKQNSYDEVVEKASATSGNKYSASPSVGTYYSNIGDSLSGTSLLSALTSLNNQKRTSTVGYKNHRNYFKYTERAASTPSNKMVGFYNNDLVSAEWDNQATWNHEHIWPNSRGAGEKSNLSSPYIDADIHMVRPAAQSVNSSRGNLMYAASGAYDPGQYVNEYRGIAARIIFYCAIADTRLTLTENTSDASSHNTMGKLSDLLKWNLQYAPSTSSSASLALQVEQNRNEVIYSDIQGNRNPFIDHPEYACKIWGNTNSTTQQICSGTIQVSTVSLDKNTASVEMGNTTTLTATSSNGGTITWTKNNSKVSLSTTSTASGSSVTISGLEQGTTTITATNADGASASCTVTITGQSVPLKLNNTEIHLDIGEKAELIATTNDQSPVTFTFEDVAYKILGFGSTTAASGQPLKLTGLANGTTTITVTSTNGGSATCVVTVGTGQYVEPSKPKSGDRNKNLPLIIGLGGGGGAIVLAGLIVLIVLLVKKKPV